MLKAKLAQLCESILQAAQLPDNLALFDARDEYLELFAVLSAMANFPGGGILLFGVSDAADGAPAQLCGVSDAARLTQIIDWQCAEMSPPIQPTRRPPSTASACSPHRFLRSTRRASPAIILPSDGRTVRSSASAA